jgi:hypothetical protein
VVTIQVVLIEPLNAVVVGADDGEFGLTARQGV